MSGGSTASVTRPVVAGQRLPYYSNEEVMVHNHFHDCWVSYFGKVYDLTPLLAEHQGLLVQPILRFAGQDISHWFDAKTRDPKTWIDPSLNVRLPYTPYGRFVHIPPPEPVSNWDTDVDIPWWQDNKYLIGNLSKKKRKVRLLNMLSGQDDLLNVCSEETLEEIRLRYLRYNQHANSYTWKRLGRILDLGKTLEENEIPDQSDEFVALNIEADAYIPTIHVYFNDDLTVD